ncbi:hypothetical protein L1887_40017 [Cichorium endivia]|nr:hypothetical protein L1887_40017 [Cichorium endivia]
MKVESYQLMLKERVFLIISDSNHTHCPPWIEAQALLKAAPEGPASELTEDSTFVPLNPDDPTFGPPSIKTLAIDGSCRVGD